MLSSYEPLQYFHASKILVFMLKRISHQSTMSNQLSQFLLFLLRIVLMSVCVLQAELAQTHLNQAFLLFHIPQYNLQDQNLLHWMHTKLSYF